MSVNENKFLVTWIEASGNVRGQATRLKEDAKRMFDHVISVGAQYAEVRKLGSTVHVYEAPPPPAAKVKPEELPDDVLQSYVFGKGH